jgi:protease-4
VKLYPTPKDFLQEFLTSLGENTQTNVAKQEMGDLYLWYREGRKVLQFQGVQARMPFELKFE